MRSMTGMGRLGSATRRSLASGAVRPTPARRDARRRRRAVRVATWTLRAATLSAAGLLVALLVSVAPSWAAVPAAQQAVPTAAPIPAPPSISAAAAYAYDMDADTPLFALHADDRRQAGSTIKIATALVTIAHANLSDEVVVDKTDEVDPAIYSHMGIAAGDTLTVEQLLYGLLIPSGSDAAKALARHVGATLPGGSPNDPDAARVAFVAAMNDLAAGLGLANTHFVNPTGDDADGQYTTAHDLALLAAELLRNDTLAAIVRTPTWEGTSSGANPRTFSLRNVNQLLTEDPAVVGVKTGSTPDAGACLVSARLVGERNRVITVVLGSPGSYGEDGTLTEDGRWDDTRAIFAGLDADYRWVTPESPDLLPGLATELAVWRATLDPAIAQPVPVTELPQLRYRLVLGPEGPPGSQVGRLVFYAGSAMIGQRPIYQVAPPS